MTPTRPTRRELDALLESHLVGLSGPDAALARQIVDTALAMGREQVSRLDRKIVNASLKEMRRAFRVFAPYKGMRKVTIFGSARTLHGDPEYVAARDFARSIAEVGWMVITGAGPGIMEAGHEGAGPELSFGVNIILPFEAEPNPVIAADAKLVNFKYFFTRKLTFMKEADAFVLLPGGFGTLDETFELLTLVQTGKSELKPIVLLSSPGNTYWDHFDAFVRDHLVERGYVDPQDTTLYRMTHDPAEAVREIQDFYRIYHSSRLIDGRLVLRLKTAPDDDVLQWLSGEFVDILHGPIERVSASAAERRDRDVPDLPRIALDFDRRHTGRLRLLVDRLNEWGREVVPATADKGAPEEV